MPSFYEVYRSPNLDACEQRAFVLRAVGIEHLVGNDGGWFLVLVPEALAQRAVDELHKYESENRVRALPREVQLHGFAAPSSAIYIAVLILCSYLAGVQWGGIDWLEAGALLPDERAGGQPWRIITALTLHADVGHLLGNLAFGGLFGFFAAQLIGPGTAWVSILLAGALGNWVDTLLMRAAQTTIGASTAVFATLGMVACYALLRHTAGAPRWAHRWAPLVVAIALLAFTGAGGERTDVVAHLTGFGAGALVGLVHAFTPARSLLVKIPQWVSGVVALMLLVGAWTLALFRI